MRWRWDLAAAYKVGENTKSMILTRALAEMSRFGRKVRSKSTDLLRACLVSVIYSQPVAVH